MFWYLSLFKAVVLYLNTNITGKGNVIWLEDLGILGSWLLSSTWVIFIWKSNKTKGLLQEKQNGIYAALHSLPFCF